MYIKLTEHYRGRFPADAGGVVFGGFGRKEVPENVGKRIVKLTFPMVAECREDGSYVGEVPPVKVIEFPDTTPEPQVSLPEPEPSTQSAVDAGVQTADEDQPTIEEVTETPKPKTRSKRK